MIVEKMVLNESRNVTLTAYLQDVGGEFGNISRRPAILVLPGGGYAMCSDREADPVALAYLEAGYQAFILRYSVGEHAQWPNPLQDYEQAMRLIRSKETEWNLYPDKVAVIGFSAGGHLAACAAAIAENKPDAAILGYAVTEGEAVRCCLKSAPDVVGRVDKKTSPCFLFATRTDNLVPVNNSIHFMEALAENGVMFESHIYAYGPHGFSVGNSSVMAPGAHMCSRVPRWMEDSIEWLKDILGDFSFGEMSEPKCAKRVNGDCDEYLSADCTVGHLMANEQARGILMPVMEAVWKQMEEVQGGKMPDDSPDGDCLSDDSHEAGFLLGMTLRSVLQFGNVGEETIGKLDAQLGRIRNELT